MIIFCISNIFRALFCEILYFIKGNNNVCFARPLAAIAVIQIIFVFAPETGKLFITIRVSEETEHV